MTNVKAFLAAKARRAVAVASVMVGTLAAAPSAMAGSGLSVPSVSMKTPPGASEIDTLLGYASYAACAACLGGVIFYVMKMVTAHLFGRQASEHNGILGACLAGAIILGTAGSALNGLL